MKHLLKGTMAHEYTTQNGKIYLNLKMVNESVRRLGLEYYWGEYHACVQILITVV